MHYSVKFEYLYGPKFIFLVRVIVDNSDEVIANVEFLVATGGISGVGGHECGHMEDNCRKVLNNSK